MARFPLFIELHHKKCVVIGGGAVAARKVETLLRFGAAVTVIGATCNSRIREWAQTGQIIFRERRYQRGDLQDSLLAVAATDDPETNLQIYEEATEAGIWINVADDPEKCSFLFPAVVRRDQVVVGITSSGVFPALTRKIREMIEQMLPADLNGKSIELSQARTRAKRDLADPADRRAVLRELAEKTLTPNRAIFPKDGPGARQARRSVKDADDEQD